MPAGDSFDRLADSNRRKCSNRSNMCKPQLIRMQNDAQIEAAGRRDKLAVIAPSAAGLRSRDDRRAVRCTRDRKRFGGLIGRLQARVNLDLLRPDRGIQIGENSRSRQHIIFGADTVAFVCYGVDAVAGLAEITDRLPDRIARNAQRLCDCLAG